MLWILIGDANSQNYNLIHFTREDGIASNSIFDVEFGPNGKLWLATEAGVTTFDGYSFNNFTVTDGLADHDILDIFKDSKNRLWFISFSGLLTVFEHGRFHPYEFNRIIHEYKKGRLTPHVDFYVDKNDEVRISFPMLGSISIDSAGNLNTLEEFAVFTENNKQYLKQVENGRFFYYPARQNGQGKKIFDFITTVELNNEKKLELANSRNEINYDYVNSNIKGDSLIVAISSDLYIIYRDHIIEHKRFSRPIVAMSIEKNELWLDMHKEGLIVLDLRNLEDMNQLLKGLIVSGHMMDEEGGTWISTVTNGLYYLPNRFSSHLDIPDRETDKSITALYLEKDKLFAGTKNAEVFEIRDEKVLKTYLFQDQYSQNTGTVDKILKYDSKLYVNCRNYLSIFENEHSWEHLICSTEIDQNHHCSVRSLYKNSKNELLIGGLKFIRKINKDGAIDIYSDSEYRVTFETVVEESTSTYWTGSSNGLGFIENGAYKDLSANHPFFKNHLVSLLNFNDSNLIIGSKSFGLAVYNHKINEVIEISNQDINCNITITNMLLDSKNNVWVSSLSGLYKLQRNADHWELSTFNEFDGIPSGVVYDLQIQNDSLYLATEKGIVIVDTRFLNQDKHRPEIFLESVVINQRDTIIQETYVLPYTSDQISIAYNAVDFKSAGNIEFQYRLKGKEKLWNKTKEKSIHYAGLSPGTYQLDIRAVDANGLMSSEDISVKFILTSPFWEQAWFVVLYLIVGVLIMGIIFKVQLMRLQKKSALKVELAKKIANLEISSLRSQMNPHFIFNTMNSILYLVDKEDKENSKKYIKKFSTLLRKIIETSPISKINLEEEIKILTTYIELEKLRFENEFSFEVRYNNDFNPKEVLIPSLIFQPYVENALIHGLLPMDKAGKIELSIYKENGTLLCTIVDNGIGREKSTEIKARNKITYKSIGISNTEKRINLINSGGSKDQLHVELIDLYKENGEAKGTMVKLRIKI